VAHRAATQSSFTLASAASMLTGTYPEVHGAIEFYDKVSSYTLTLPEYLSQYGFDTTCFAGMNFFTGPWGLGRGFNKTDYLEPEKQKRQSKQARADEISDGFIHYIETVKQPFFSLLWFFDLHPPSITPEEYRDYFNNSETGNERIDRYDSELKYIDYHIGRIFEALCDNKMLDNTFIAITGDHGEVFNEHYMFENRLSGRLAYRLPVLKKVITRNGYLDHLGIPPWDELLRVPLIMKFPGKEEGHQINSQLELIDLFPTVLDVLGLKAKGIYLQGKSINQQLKSGGIEDEGRIVFSYTKPTKASALFTCAMNNEYKLIKIFPPDISVMNIKASPKTFAAGRMMAGEMMLKVGTDEKRDFSNDHSENLYTLRKELLTWRMKNEILREKLKLTGKKSQMKLSLKKK
jgi:arylsulfatase A-like enzyme